MARGSLSPPSDARSVADLIVAEGFPPLDAAACERIHDDISELAARAFPGYRLTADVFALAVQGGPEKAAPPSGWPHGVRWLDLVLLDGFRQGHLDATRGLVEGIMAEAASHLRRMGASAEEADDLVQDRLARLLGPRRDIGYGGRGPLAAWVRRCLERDLVSLRRREEVERRHAPVARAERLLPEVMTLPELPARQEALNAALQTALAGLDEHMRRLLRYIYIDGLTASQAGALLGVHRVSIQRRLAEARYTVKMATRAELVRTHGIAVADASSLVRTLLGGFEVTVSRLLQSR